jgi:hypothetical protein
MFKFNCKKESQVSNSKVYWCAGLQTMPWYWYTYLHTSLKSNFYCDNVHSFLIFANKSTEKNCRLILLCMICFNFFYLK